MKFRQMEQTLAKRANQSPPRLGRLRGTLVVVSVTGPMRRDRFFRHASAGCPMYRAQQWFRLQGDVVDAKFVQGRGDIGQHLLPAAQVFDDEMRRQRYLTRRYRP